MSVQNNGNTEINFGPTIIFNGGGNGGGFPGLPPLPPLPPLPFFGLNDVARDTARTLDSGGRDEGGEVRQRGGEQADMGDIDDVADGLGSMVNDADDPALARDLNALEGDMRDLMADGDLSHESLDAMADRMGEMVNDIDDPAMAAELNELETKLREAMPPKTPQADPEEIDAVADDLGSLANDVDDPELAAEINDIETELRELMADGDLSAEALDKVADRMGSLVNDIDDQDIAARLNDIETDLREAMPSGEASGEGLSTEGNNTIDTGRYEITAKKDEVVIRDKETGETIRAWGDPHLHTSDGDKAQFHEDNLTIDLPDGTKVTLVPTEKNDKGLSFVDQVAVTKGDEAVVMSGIHDNDISHTGVMDGEGVADGVDRSFEDGTVLETGDQIDDLFFTDRFGNATEEIVGTDPNARFGEHMLDGRGGSSDLGVER